MAGGYRDVNTARTVVGTLQKGPAVAVTTIQLYNKRVYACFVLVLGACMHVHVCSASG